MVSRAVVGRVVPGGSRRAPPRNRGLEGRKTWTITSGSFKTVSLIRNGRELVYDYRYQRGDLEQDRVVLKCEVGGGVSPVTLYRKGGTIYVKEPSYDLALKKVH